LKNIAKHDNLDKIIKTIDRGNQFVKKTLIIILSAIVIVVTSLGITLISGYNQLVDADEAIAYQYSVIDTRLQQRYDTLTQLATAVSGFQTHEQTIYDMITSAREAYATAKAANDIEGMIEADSLQSIALADLLVLFEDNEPLQATDAYGDYMDAVWGIESALSEARRQYNLAVQDYNAYIRRFPGLMYVSIFTFPDTYGYWKANDGATDIPDVVLGS